MPWWWKQYFPTKQLWRYGDLISNLKRQKLLIIFVTFCTCLTILDQFDEFQVFRVPKKKMMLKNWRKKKMLEHFVTHKPLSYEECIFMKFFVKLISLIDFYYIVEGFNVSLARFLIFANVQNDRNLFLNPMEKRKFSKYGCR